MARVCNGRVIAATQLCNTLGCFCNIANAVIAAFAKIMSSLRTAMPSDTLVSYSIAVRRLDINKPFERLFVKPFEEVLGRTRTRSQMQFMNDVEWIILIRKNSYKFSVRCVCNTCAHVNPILA